ncbi:MAG: hypothetical protein CBC25_05390 [Pelagibacteraceae bacterium TMED65]|nr:hypothetical protein [Rickettsiales bacterium]OUU51493.1 MAG: hypothetical protein CBC25_05390 [Pelagibacteraceae bacterium TMED65]
MIIKFGVFTDSINQYFKNNCFLFYGQNFGKVDYALNYVLTSKKKETGDFEIIHIYTEELKKSDFLKISHEAIEPNLFGIPKVYIVSLTSEKNNKEIISFLNSASKNCIILLKSEQLSPKSPIRVFFEKSSDHIIVPCYEETNFEKNQLISSYFENEGIHISQVQVQNISALVPNERTTIINEIEKLVIILKSSKANNFNDAMFSYLSESTNVDLTKFINNLCLGEIKSFSKEYNTVTDFGKNNMKLMTLLIDHFFKLLTVKQNIREGKTMQDAVAMLRPKVFFKYLDSFYLQLQKFSEDQIYIFIKKLYLCRMSVLSGRLSSNYFLLISLINLFLVKKT